MNIKDLTNKGEVTLTNCADEPIHIPGSIQRHGLLLALTKIDLTISFCSANVSDFCPFTYEQLLGKSYELVFGTEARRQLNDYLNLPAHTYQGPLAVELSGQDFVTTIHSSGDFYVMEFERAVHEERILADIYEQTRQFTTYMENAATLRDLCQAVATQTRQITGYDRVMIYQFDHEYNGHVIAESKIEQIDSFLDLHYPHTDIPVQARALYMKNLLRMIVDVNYQPAAIFTIASVEQLDLGNSILRSVSPIHIQYLKNIGVGASMSISLVHENRLWGLIACHHYSPKFISGDIRIAAQLQGHFLTSQINVRQQAEEYGLSLQTDQALNSMLELIYSGEHLPVDEIVSKPDILLLANATGIVFLIDDAIYSQGKVPTPLVTHKLINWLQTYSSGKPCFTSKLISVYPDAASFQDLAGGIIFHPLGGAGSDAVIWFRHESREEVTWAGNPEEAIKKATTELTPRNSFNSWTDIRKGESYWWEKPELAAAATLTRALEKQVHMIHLSKAEAKQRKLNEQLIVANAELENLYWIGSHDLKEPLRKIQVSASRIIDGEKGPSIDFIIESVKRMNESAKRMQLLLTDILSYSKLSHIEERLQSTNLNEVLAHVIDELTPEVKRKNAFLKKNKLPIIKGIESFLQQLFLNLIQNSLKFSRLGIDPLIDIHYHGVVSLPVDGGRSSQRLHHITVEDNGIGFDNRYNESIFKVFTRLHAHNEYGGSGVGLALCRKIMLNHNGFITTNGVDKEGAIFNIYFPTD